MNLESQILSQIVFNVGVLFLYISVINHTPTYHKEKHSLTLTVTLTLRGIKSAIALIVTAAVELRKENQVKKAKNGLHISN